MAAKRKPPKYPGAPVSVDPSVPGAPNLIPSKPKPKPKPVKPAKGY